MFGCFAIFARCRKSLELSVIGVERQGYLAGALNEKKFHMYERIILSLDSRMCLMREVVFRTFYC